MFSVAGLILSKLLPENKDPKILGINNRIFFAVINAFLIALIEGPLAAFLCYDEKLRTDRILIGGLFALNLIMMLIFIPLGWI